METSDVNNLKNPSLGQALEEFNDDLMPAGFLSDVDIQNLLDNDIVICNYDEDNLTDIGYNLTSTDFIFSINNGLLVEIQHNENEKFCYIEPHDTVLVITRESIWVSDKISGTFHSKVKMVSAGFGHVSTTLDPFWEGPLVISINNPTNKKLKFLIEKDKKDGKGFKHCSFVTLIFYKMVTAAKKAHDNKSCRLDILKDIVEKPNDKDKNYYKYDELDKTISSIAELDFVKTSVKELRNPLKRKVGIETFKKKGNEFDRQINDYIQQANSVTKTIRNTKVKKKKMINRVATIISMIFFVIPIGIIIYIAVKNQDNSSVTLGQTLSLFSSIYLSLVPQVVKYSYLRKEK